jgi:ferredoxin
VNEMVLFGAPVYAGRLPEVASKRLSRFTPAGAPAAAIVLYGNREYEDALVELGDLVTGTGCVVIAGGAFLGEHSYSTPEQPIAVGRPDEKDREKAVEFGRQIMELFESISKPDDVTPPDLPGNRPYRKMVNHPKAPPETDTDLCNLCGICVSRCPTGAITLHGDLETTAADCILCCACIKACPQQARALTDPHMKRITAWVSKKAAKRKEPETFIGGRKP